MLIDIHVHACRRTVPVRQDGTFQPTAEELVGMMDDHGIAKALVMARMSPECGLRYVTPEQVLETCAEFPDRLIPAMSLDPRMAAHSPQSDFRSLLRHYQEAGCRAFGEYAPCLPFDDPLNVTLFKQAAEFGLPLIFHIAPEPRGYYGCCDTLGLPHLENALRLCPELTFVAHSQPFWAEISADLTEATRKGYPTGKVTPGRVVALMRKYPTLYGDLSAGSGYNAISRDPDFGCQFLEEFQDRLCFGTDICYVGQELPQVAYFRKLREQRMISETAWEKITWRNADRILRLGLGSAAD